MRRSRRPRPTPAAALALLLLVLVSSACSNGREGAAPTSAPSESSSSAPAGTGGESPAVTTSTTLPDLSGAVQLTEIGTFNQPLGVYFRPNLPVMFVAEKGGRVVTDGGIVVLDIRGEVSTGSEQGLLGVAFHPDDDLMYVNFTDTDGDSHIVEFRLNGNVADTGSRRELLSVDQPFANHNGGQLAFGPDGMLYIGLGDGGSAGDPQGNGQSLRTLLGKILRIDPRPSGGEPYAIPPDNPFVDRSGARSEIWAFGLRNPWRFSFDRANGDLWIGDVGQGDREEIDRQAADSGGGENYGWNIFEGTRRFTRGSAQGLIPPLFEYELTGGNCAVTGGFVYRGAVIPALSGRYVFADFCAGALLTLVDRAGQLQAVPLGPTVESLSSFGEGNDGELYATSLSTGVVFRLDRS